MVYIYIYTYNPQNIWHILHGRGDVWSSCATCSVRAVYSIDEYPVDHPERSKVPRVKQRPLSQQAAQEDAGKDSMCLWKRMVSSWVSDLWDVYRWNNYYQTLWDYVRLCETMWDYVNMFRIQLGRYPKIPSLQIASAAMTDITRLPTWSSGSNRCF